MPDQDINQTIIDKCNQKRPLKLFKPILIEGQERDTLDWDANKVTIDQFLEAASKAESANKTMETDFTFHLWLGCEMAVAADDKIDLVSLQQQLSGPDAIKVTSLGRFFILASEGSDLEDSEEPSESTPESSEKPEENSDDGQSPTS